MPFRIRSRFFLASMLAVVFIAASFWTARAEQAGRGAGPQSGDQPRALSSEGSCPGKEGPTQYSGKTENRPIPTAIANGKPMSGTWSEPGARSYWHCHPGGQFLIVMEGVGRAQKRGERMRDLAVGEIEFAGPWVEHWHGAAQHSAAQFLQLALQPTGTRWLEPVSADDYLGNDNGFRSRAAFLAAAK
jgi:quercetin dioxygenase-like cupin family protein